MEGEKSDCVCVFMLLLFTWIRANIASPGSLANREKGCVCVNIGPGGILFGKDAAGDQVQ